MHLKFVCTLTLVVLVHGYIDRKSIASGFWSVPAGDFDQVNGDIIMALADFNQDRQYIPLICSTDIVTVDSVFMQQLSIYLWNSTQSENTRNLGAFVRRILKSTLGKPIVSVIPGTNEFTQAILTMMGSQISWSSMTSTSPILLSSALSPSAKQNVL